MTALPRRRPSHPELLARLRASKEKVLALHREIIVARRGSLASARQIVDAAATSLRRIAQQVGPMFARLSTNLSAATDEYRAFQIDHGIERNAREPNLATTVMVTQAVLLAEAVVTAGLLVSDGRVGPVTAVIYAVSFAALTTAVAAAVGFFPCRYLGYRIDAPEPKPRDARIRALAWGGFGVGVTVLGALIFAAARARVSGNKDIWNFETVPLAATVEDYYAAAIIILGVLGAVLAIYKGWTGIKDAVPGYLEAKQAAERYVLNATEELSGHYEHAVETTFEDACKTFDAEVKAFEEARETLTEGLLELGELITAHNHAVQSARELTQDDMEAERTRAAFITRNPEDGYAPPFDGSAFDELLIPVSYLSDLEALETEDGSDIPALRAELESAYVEALAAILDARAAFLTNSAPIDLIKKGE